MRTFARSTCDFALDFAPVESCSVQRAHGFFGIMRIFERVGGQAAPTSREEVTREITVGDKLWKIAGKLQYISTSNAKMNEN